eukprot:70521-Prorocentrum_minimum.AAC.1
MDGAVPAEVGGGKPKSRRPRRPSYPPARPWRSASKRMTTSAYMRRTATYLFDDSSALRAAISTGVAWGGGLSSPFPSPSPASPLPFALMRASRLATLSDTLSRSVSLGNYCQQYAQKQARPQPTNKAHTIFRMTHGCQLRALTKPYFICGETTKVRSTKERMCDVPQ